MTIESKSRPPSIKEIRRIAKLALGQLDVDRAAPAVLEGSIAEGFGNACSDIDFLVVEDGTARRIVRTVVFIEQHRVEVHFRSLEDHLAIAGRVNAVDGSDVRRLRSLAPDDLDKYQRFLRAVPVRNPGAVRRLQKDFTDSKHAEVCALSFSAKARDALECASVMAQLGCREEALVWAKKGLVAAAKCWCAERGEGYLSNKWIGIQLQRAGMKAEQRSSIREMMLTTSDKLGPLLPAIDRYVEQSGELGVPVRGAGADEIVVEREGDASEWTLGSAVYVLLREEAVYRLSAAAERLWGQLASPRPLTELVQGAGSPDSSERAGAIVADLHRAGLVSFGRIWRKGRWRRREVSRLWLTSEAGSPRADVEFVPMPAREFVTRGIGLWQGQFALEAIREDIVGAHLGGQWAMLEFQLHRLTATAAQMLLVERGLTAAPNEELVETWLVRLGWENVLRRYRALGVLRVTDEETYRLASAKVGEFLDFLESQIGDLRIGRLLESNAGYKEGMDVGRGWSTLALRFGVREPEFMTLAPGRDAYAYERASAWAAAMRHSAEFADMGIPTGDDSESVRSLRLGAAPDSADRETA